MPRRSARTPDPTPNPFEQAQAGVRELLGRTPVERQALLGALAAAEVAGTAMAGEKTLGVIHLATGMVALNQEVLQANTEGRVEPPLEPTDVAAIDASNNTFQIFIDNDPGAGGQTGPTDPGQTAGRKG